MPVIAAQLTEDRGSNPDIDKFYRIFIYLKLYGIEQIKRGREWTENDLKVFL